MKSKLIKLCLCTLALNAWANASFAAWSLDNEQSRLSFISIKASDIGEVHTFSQLSGGIADDGTVTIEINLASVETLIPIRNERMQELLFETTLFPTAIVSATLDSIALNSLTQGSLTAIDVQATLTIKEQAVPLNLKLFAAKLGADTMVVTSAQPVLINAASVGLSAGVEKLREIAGLPNISQAVPVSFVLTFNADQAR